MEQTNFGQEEKAEGSATGVNERPERPATVESYEDLYGQLAQKDRDLVLAAELGKALLESNQELQRRHDTMCEEYSVKLESLQQEKYNLHLEIEKIETEQRNKLKDLQDDISSLREQLRSTNQHQHDNDAETSRTLIEAKQKSDYLAEQIQQACKREEELQLELQDEKAKNETSSCVIQDHLEHITMLREQVEYLSEKLRETSQTLLEVQEERDRLLQMKERAQDKISSLAETIEQQEETIKSQESQIKQLEAQIQSKMKKSSTQTAKHHSLKGHHSDSSHHLSRSKGRSSKYQQPEQLQTHYCNETADNTFPLVPSSIRPTDVSDNISELSSHSLCSDESIVRHLPHESLLSEFSMTIHHHRNKSDCSVTSLSEGSRKRHHETIAGESDDEVESSDKSSKSSACKQTLFSELMECSGFVPTSSKHGMAKPILPLNLDDKYHQSISDTDRSEYLTPPPDNLINLCHMNQSPHSTHSDPSSGPLTPPEDDISCDNVLQYSQQMSLDSHWKQNPPLNREASLFEELSSKLTDLDRQNSNSSEKSLFDELSGHVRQEDICGTEFTSTCLLGHPDYYGQSDGHDSYGQRRSEDESSYTCEWPLLTSVSADMLDGDDFECDDDDFLVGNVAGSTLSIGDSGVGIMLNPFSSKMETSDISKELMESHSRQIWRNRMDTESSDKQDLKEACRLMRDLVDRLNGDGEDVHNLSGPVNDLPDYESKEETTFDHLFLLIKKAKQRVDEMEQGGVSHLRKYSARQWQLEATEPVMEEFKIPALDYPCQHSQALPHWSKRRDLRKSSSSSSLILRRSL